MRCFKRSLVLLGVGFALIAAAAPVRADFVTVSTAAIPLTQTNWTPTTASLAGVNPFQLDQLGTALTKAGVVIGPGQSAVLTKVELTLDYRFDNTLQIRFDNLSTIGVNASGSMQVFLGSGITPSSGQAPIITPPTFANSSTLSSSPSDIFSKYVTVPTKSFTGTQTASLTDQASLNKFLGNGTVSLPVFASATSNFTTSSANGFGSSVTYASAGINVVYTFAIVPEPTAFVLCGIGVAALLGTLGSRSRRDRVKFDPSV